MEHDTKTSYQRIGYSFLFKKIAHIVSTIGIMGIVLLWLATMLTTLGTKQIEARTAVANIRYLNIKH